MLWILPLMGCEMNGSGPDEETSPTIEPTASCVLYLACLTAVGDENLALQEQAIGPGGTCWIDPVAALGCDEVCDGGLILQRELTPEVDACYPDGQAPTTASDLPVSWSLNMVETLPSSMANCEQGFQVGDSMELEAIDDFIFRLTLPEGSLSPGNDTTECTLADDLSYSCDDFDAQGSFSPGLDEITFRFEISGLLECELVAQSS